MSYNTRQQTMDEGYGSDHLHSSPMKRKIESALARESAAFKENYKVLGVIHNSANGTIYDCIRKVDGLSCVAKQVSKTKISQWVVVPNSGRRIPKEFYFHQLASSVDGVIGVLDYFERRTSWVLVMEKPENSTDLFEVSSEVGRFDESVAKVIWRQICQTTLNLHRVGVFHRDIKDENIIVDVTTLTARIIDFGCSDSYGPTKLYSTFAGTREFAPPEVFTADYHLADPTTVWSLGTLLYTMLMGSIPFETAEDIVTGEASQSISSLTPDAQDVIEKCLRSSPAARPSIEELLAHPFLH